MVKVMAKQVKIRPCHGTGEGLGLSGTQIITVIEYRKQGENDI